MLQLLHRLQVFVRIRMSLPHYSNRINSRPRPKLPERPPDWVTKMLLCDYVHFQRCTTYNCSNVMNADNGQPSATCPALDRYSRWQLSCEGCKKRWQVFQWVEPMAEGPSIMYILSTLDQHQLISHPFNLDRANAIRDGFSHCNSLKCFRMPKHQVDRGLTIHVNLLIASVEGTAILTCNKQGSSEYHRMAEPTHDPLAYAHAHWRADGCRSLSSCSNAPDFFLYQRP